MAAGSTQLSHVERMSVAGHYLADTWWDIDDDVRELIRDRAPRLALQLDQLMRVSVNKG